MSSHSTNSSTRSSFFPGDMPNDPEEETAAPQDDQPTGPGLTVADVLAKLQANPYIINRWREITGERRYYSAESIAQHIFNNPALWPLLDEEPPTEDPGASEHVGGQTDQEKWGPPSKLTLTRQAVPDPELPEAIRPYVLALVEEAGSSVGTALQAVMGAGEPGRRC